MTIANMHAVGSFVDDLIGRGIVSMRVVFALRSAEIWPLFLGFYICWGETGGLLGVWWKGREGKPGKPLYDKDTGIGPANSHAKSQLRRPNTR